MVSVSNKYNANMDTINQLSLNYEYMLPNINLPTAILISLAF